MYSEIQDFKKIQKATIEIGSRIEKKTLENIAECVLLLAEKNEVTLRLVG